MIRVSFHRLRVEPLEERWLPAATLAPVGQPVAQHSSAASAQTEAKNEDSEYADGTGDDKQSATESPQEFKSTENTPSSGRFENPYFFNNQYYAVVAIPPPPAPALPTSGTVDTSATEPRTVARPADQVSPPVPDELPATVPTSTSSDSHPLASVPESLPEMPADPPPVDEQEVPTTPPVDESTPQSGSTLLDDLSVRLHVGEWEQAGGKLLDGLDQVIADVTDPDSPLVRLGYWIGTAAALGVAVELSRHGLRARRPRLDLRLSARLPVNR